MARTSAHDQALRLLARALHAGAVVEVAGRALAVAFAPGPVLPRDRAGTWPGFIAREPGLFACCPLLPAGLAIPLPQAFRGWLRLGDADEPPQEFLPVAQWLAAMSEAEASAFAVGLLHGLGRIADSPTRPMPPGRSRLLVRAPESLARELLG